MRDTWERVELGPPSGQWVSIPLQTLDYLCAHLSPSAVVLWLVLRDHQGQHESSWPSRDALAERLRVSTRQITTLLRQLEEHELLDVQRRGCGLSNVYKLWGRARPRAEEKFTPELKKSSAQELKESSAPIEENQSKENQKKIPRAATRGRSLALPLNGGSAPLSAKRVPDSRIKELIDEFSRLHLEHMQAPYLVVGGRDGKALKSALALKYSADAIKRCMLSYFVDHRRSIDNVGARIPIFVQLLATIASKLGPPRKPTRFIQDDPAYRTTH